MPNSGALEQISKRVDSVEKDVDDLQEHAHESDKAIVAMDGTIKHIAESHIDLKARVSENESDTIYIRLIKKHPKTILTLIGFFIFSLKADTKEILELVGKYAPW
jgi:chromosome segregation ATPase